MKFFPIEIIFEVYKWLTPWEKKELRKVSKLFRNIWQFPSVRIHKELLKYFPNRNFNRMMYRHGNPAGIISGSFVLACLNDEVWVPNDLDIFCNKSYRKLFQKFLEQNNYKEINRECNPKWASHPDYDDDWNVISYTWKNKKVQIISHDYLTGVKHLKQFWGTHVMNFWDGYRIWCAFPKLTMSRKIIKTFYEQDENDICSDGVIRVQRRELVQIEKYIKRGYSVDKKGKFGKFFRDSIKFYEI